MTDIVEITTTTETAAQAQALARQMVAARLAACVQITGPIQSIYRWQGEVCEATEYRCTLKTTMQLVPDVTQAIEEHHPYEVPEILVLETVACSASYAQWLHAQLRA